jgi:hypothetical protein
LAHYNEPYELGILRYDSVTAGYYYILTACSPDLCRLPLRTKIL